jgi:glycosyltransferase involved in cell wall biosynthesis
MSKINVLITVPKGIEGKGGVERLMKDIISSDELVNFEFCTIKTVGEGGLANRLFFSLTSIVKSICIVKLNKIDIFHVNMSTHGSAFRKVILIIISSMMNCRVLLHLHGAGFDNFYRERGAIARAFISFGFRRASSIVVLGKFWRDFLREEGLADDERIHIVSNGAKDPYGGRIARNTHADPVKIVFAGEVGPRKGVGVLLEALARLETNIRPWQLHIAGNGDINGLKDDAARLGISDKVFFYGWVSSEQVHDLFRRADIMVLPSFAENQPISIIEAMAASLPVVSTQIAAIDEEVVDGVTGYLVPPGNIIELADRLSALISRSDLRQEMGREGRARFDEIFEFSRFLERLSFAYRATLSAQDRGTAAHD